MSEIPCRALIEQAYDENVKTRIGAIHRVNDVDISQRQQVLERLKKAVRTLRSINEICEDADDLYQTFTRERLSELIIDIRNGVNTAKRLAEATGFLDALDQYFDVMIDCLRAEHFPAGELDLLRSLGSTNPEKELEVLVFVLKARKPYRPILDRWENPPLTSIRVSEQLQRLQGELQDASTQVSFTPDQRHKPIRWFKSLGQIGTGAAMTIFDVMAAASLLPFPVDPASQSYGAMLSVVGGIGQILNGYGEWRNE